MKSRYEEQQVVADFLSIFCQEQRNSKNKSYQLCQCDSNVSRPKSTLFRFLTMNDGRHHKTADHGSSMEPANTPIWRQVSDLTACQSKSGGLKTKEEPSVAAGHLQSEIRLDPDCTSYHDESRSLNKAITVTCTHQ